MYHQPLTLRFARTVHFCLLYGCQDKGGYPPIQLTGFYKYRSVCLLRGANCMFRYVRSHLEFRMLMLCHITCHHASTGCNHPCHHLYARTAWTGTKIWRLEVARRHLCCNVQRPEYQLCAHSEVPFIDFHSPVAPLSLTASVYTSECKQIDCASHSSVPSVPVIVR